MKKLLLTFFAILTCFFNLNAQDRIIDTVGRNGFQGFKSLERGMFYFTYYFSDSVQKNGMTTLIVPFLSESLVIENKMKLELPIGTEVISASSNGMIFSFVLGDVKKKTITYIVTDRSGKDIKKKVIERVPEAQFRIENKPKCFTIMPEHILIVRPLLDKKGGYDVECMDKDLNPVWKKTFTPEKGNWEIVYNEVDMDKLYIVYKETSPGKTVFKLHAIQVNSGIDVCTAEYSKDGDYYQVDFAAISEGGMLTAGGSYYASSNSTQKPDGIFAAITDPSGHFVTFQKLAYKDFPDSVKNMPTARFLADGSLKLMVQDIIQNHGGMGYTLVAEAYREATTDELKGVTGKVKGITLSDFVFLSYSQQNELIGINFAEKEPMTAAVKGKLAEADMQSVANWLDKKGFFCYRTSTIEREKSIVVYKNFSTDRFKVFMLPTDLKDEKMAAISEIGAMPDLKAAENKSLKYFIFDSDASKETPDTNPVMSKEILPSKRGFVLLYYYAPPRIAITQQPITAH